VTDRLVLTAALAAAVMMAFGSWGIPYLRALHVQQRIRAEAPSQHQGKAGTPTMGGLLLVPSVVAATVLAAPQISWDLMVPLVAMLAYGAVGAIDDALALRFHRNLGLRARERLIVQFALAAAVALFVLRFTGAPDRVLPLVGAVAPGVYAVFVVLYLVGFTNAVISPMASTGWPQARWPSLLAHLPWSPRQWGGRRSRSCVERWPVPARVSYGSTRIRRRCSWGMWGPMPWGLPSPRSPS